jgi:hypothetical protein
MKTLFLASVLLLGIITHSWAQHKVEHFPKAQLESQPNDLLTFSNEEYIVLVGAHPTDDGVNMYSMSWSNIRTQVSGSIQLKGQNTNKSTFYGHHFNRDVFAFFEETYDQNQRVYILVLHELYLLKGVVTNRVIHRDVNDVAHKKSYFAKPSHGKFFINYEIVKRKTGEQYTKIYSLDYEYKIKELATLQIKEKLDLDFNNVLQLTDNGDVLAVLKINNEKEGNRLVYQYGNILEGNTDAFSEFRTLFHEKEIQIHDFKVYLNQESIVEFVGLYNKKGNEGMQTRMLVRYFHPLKERLLVDKDFEVGPIQDLRMHSLVPINDQFFVLVTQTKINTAKPDQKEVRKSISLTQATSIANTAVPNQEGIHVAYVHLQKGVIWKKILNYNEKFHSVEANINALDYFFWSDGTNLYALHNMLPEKSNTTTNDAKSVTIEGVLNTGLQIFNLNSGESKVLPISIEEAVERFTVLPGLSKITSVDYLSTVAQIDKKTFYPILIHFLK